MASSQLLRVASPAVLQPSYQLPAHGGRSRCTPSCANAGNFQGYKKLQVSKQNLRQKKDHARPVKARSASSGYVYQDTGGNGGIGGKGGDGQGGGGSGGGGGEGSGDLGGSRGPFGAIVAGWQERVRADPSFVFKVFTEQIIGVTASVIGDMAGRPNFGLNELDFVFSTLIVGSILNFSLMYMLAPTGAAAVTLPGIFASCPTGHLFEPGSYSVIQRAGTFVYKGVQFAGVGFAAGLVGTGLTNVLLKVRKGMDPNFKGNPPPPMVLNAVSWGLHMGVSSNIRYQTLNGLEFFLEPKLAPGVFRTLVFLLRTGNNVLGGTSFAVLAKITGSQKSTS